MGDAANDVQEIVEKLIELSRLQVDVDVEEGESVISVRLSGADSEIVLENGAKVLYALNDILRQVFFRRSEARVEVDCDDFRATRVYELELLARKAAERVRQTGELIKVQPMPPGERRTIHITLAEESGVRTESRGAGDSRHVIVIPE